MAAIDFPNNPNISDIHTQGGVSWTWTGITWDLVSNGGSAAFARLIETFIATQGQTIFTISDGYFIGQVDVFVNGVRLSSDDFTATNGSTIILNTPVDANDIVDVIKFIATIGGDPSTGEPIELRTAGDISTGALRYAGLTKTTGQLYGGSNDPTSLVRLNYDGIFSAKSFKLPFGELIFASDNNASTSIQFGSASITYTITNTEIGDGHNFRFGSTTVLKAIKIGAVLINTATQIQSGVTLQVNGDGFFNSTVTATNFITTSDRKIKTEIIPIENALSILEKFTSYEYLKNGVKEAGFIAQEVKEVLPYTVFENKDGLLTMSDRPILAYLHKAVLELKNEINIIKSKL